jgi:uncharacterized protein YndB with AHSA1/START domain
MAKTSSRTATVTLPADDQILITREFDAPKDLVYRTWTTPDLVRRWWAGPRGEVTIAEIDLRVGGSWRYVMVTGGGLEIAFHGEYREIVPNQRIVSTEVFEGLPDAGGSVVTTTFVELDGHTTLSLLGRYPSREVRDAVINSGMEGGMQEQMDAIEQIVISLR